MHLWIKKISTQLDQHLRTGGRDTDEWIWDTIINDFAQNFQDIMSQEKAQKQLFKLQMERGELDDYTSKYQQLCELAGYYEQTCHDLNVAPDYFSFVYPSLIPFSSHPLFSIWTILCLLIHVNS